MPLPGKTAGRAHDKLFSNQRSSTNVTSVKLQTGHPWPYAWRHKGAVSSYTGVQTGTSTHYSYKNREKDNERQVLSVKYFFDLFSFKLSYGCFKEQQHQQKIMMAFVMLRLHSYGPLAENISHESYVVHWEN